MTARHFTLEEANALLPEIRPLMAELLERRARVVDNRDQLEDVLKDVHRNMGSPVASDAVRDFIVIEQLVEQIREFGCEIKDLNIGLVDFLSEIEGREVYLCWRYGEPEIAYYHDLTAGFMGRRKIQ